jgi:hypothetical protein
VFADDGDVNTALGQRRGHAHADETTADNDYFAAQLRRPRRLLS